MSDSLFSCRLQTGRGCVCAQVALHFTLNVSVNGLKSTFAGNIAKSLKMVSVEFEVLIVALMLQ